MAEKGVTMTSATVAQGTLSGQLTEAPKMVGPILVAIDGTEDSQAALRTAAQMSMHADSPVTVLTVLEPVPIAAPEYGMLVPPVESSEARRAALFERVKSQVVQLPGDTAGWSIEMREGDPAHAIARAAREMGARLIIVGIGHHDLLDRLFGGETALHTLRQSRVPVLAVSPRQVHMPTRAIVATDFSAASVRAARTALELFDTISMLYLVHVAPRMELQPDAFAAWMALYGEGVGPAFERVKAEIGAAPGMKVETIVRQGKPSREVIEFARSASADLIITGSRGAGLLDRMLVGSTATGLVRGANCSVLAVPNPPGGERRLGMDERQQSIPRDHWAKELDAFTRRNLGRRAALEVDDPELGAQAQEHDYPLLGVAYDRHDERVEIMLGDLDGGTRHLTRGIANVREITLLPDEAGRDWILRVAHGRGQTILKLSR
jgi:nucleotide-binding universal stress UspA family protein